MDLVEILKRPEGKTLEFKRDLSSPDGALKTIVAFANTAGGTLLVGVEDRSRHVRGVPRAARSGGTRGQPRHRRDHPPFGAGDRHPGVAADPRAGVADPPQLCTPAPSLSGRARRRR